VNHERGGAFVTFAVSRSMEVADAAEEVGSAFAAGLSTTTSSSTTKTESRSFGG
jgi:hypothetical protein